jgi:hypothetical protein
MQSFLILAGLISLAISPGSRSELRLHVAPTGDDAAVGTREAPLATLAGARDRLRSLGNERASQPVVVEFAAGEYFFETPVEFARRDSGSPDAPIVYRAAPGAAVRFTAGRPVGGWKEIEKDEVLARLPEEARADVRVADLTALGITDLGHLTVGGFAMGSEPAEGELSYDDRPLTPARWPNEGFRGVEGVDGVERVTVDTDRLARWTDESDPWIFAYWYHDWADLHEPIVAIDPEARVLVRSPEVEPRYGVAAGRARWYAYNLLAELDRPGEYYIDRDAGRVYLWPPHEGGVATLSIGEGFVRAEDLSHVTFRGFTMEACRAHAIELHGGESCRIVGCTIGNVGLQAVVVRGGVGHEVYGCDIHHCGEGGVTMRGGDRPSLTPGGHNVENNHVHHFSRRARTYRTAIRVDGVGCRIAHNLIHDGPHMALAAGGNDHLVEFNEIHNVVEESGDAGAYYVGRDWTQRGNILRHNYWHQIVGVTGFGGMTIYLDDQHSGYTIHGNLFESCSQAVFIGGGDDNIVTNNVFVDCRKAMHIDDRGIGWQKAATDDPDDTLRTRFRDMPTDSERWRTRYPNLAATLDDDPNLPKRNLVRGNVSAGGSWNDIYPSIREHQVVIDNLVFDDDRGWIRIVRDAEGHPIDLEFSDPAVLEQIGFERLPLERIGLYEDPRRASWPVSHEVRPVRLPR